VQPGLICEKPIRSRLLFAKVRRCRQVAHKTKEKGRRGWASCAEMGPSAPGGDALEVEPKDGLSEVQVIQMNRGILP
jgi:hypothetical protein